MIATCTSARPGSLLVLAGWLFKSLFVQAYVDSTVSCRRFAALFITVHALMVFPIALRPQTALWVFKKHSRRGGFTPPDTEDRANVAIHSPFLLFGLGRSGPLRGGRGSAKFERPISVNGYPVFCLPLIVG